MVIGKTTRDSGVTERLVRPSTDILLLSDEGPVARAVADLLGGRGIPYRPLPADASLDQVMDHVLGCRAIVAVGAGGRIAELCRAAGMPGVGCLVLVATAEEMLDLATLRRSGVPYTVLRPAPLLENLVDDLAPVLRRGSLLLSRDAEPVLSWVAARDVGRCAVAALDADDACGRVMDVASPERLPLGELAARVAAAQGMTVEVRRLPRWALGPMRLFGRRPFEIGKERVKEVDAAEAVPLLGGRWSTVEDIMSATGEGSSIAVG